MEKVKIAEGLEFSRIIQGFWRVVDWNISTKELTEFIQGCLDRGVDTFDTADIYSCGACEEQVGRALKSVSRDRYKIVSKGGILPGTNGGPSYYDTSYQHILDTCRESIRKLNCGYLDLYLIHREDPLLNHEETARALLRLKEEGSVREIGVSNFDPHKLKTLDHFVGGQLRMNQIEWNPCCFEHFESGMMDLLQQKNIHPMIWSPLCGGKLFSDSAELYVKARTAFSAMAEKYGVSVGTMVYAWILKHPTKAMPLVGSGKLNRLDEAIAALEVDVSLEDWYQLYAASGQRVVR